MARKKKVNRKLTSRTTARFDTLEQAAAAASAIFNPFTMDSGREVGGGILKDKNGKFYFTYTIAEKDQPKVNMVIQKLKGHTLEGLWHTHGTGSPVPEVFSRDDVKASKSMKLPFYMIDHKGVLRVLKPDDKTQTINSRHNGRTEVAMKVSKGNPVLDINGNPVVLRTTREQPLDPRKKRAEPLRERLYKYYSGSGLNRLLPFFALCSTLLLSSQVW
jgi:hypothetical protein